MSRSHAYRPATFLLALGLAASGGALADDSSMSRLTGDSYAFFNNLDYHAGGFTTPRELQAESTSVAKTRAKATTTERRPAERSAAALRRLFHADGGA